MPRRAILTSPGGPGKPGWRGALWLAALGAPFVLLGSCRPFPAPLSDADVAISDCVEVLPGPTCELDPDDRRVTIWWSHAAGAPVFTTDRGVPRAIEAHDHRTGTLARFEVPAEASQLSARFVSPVGNREWRVALAFEEYDPLRSQALSLRREGRSAEAGHLLDGAPPGESVEKRLRRLSLRGRLHLDQAEPDAAVATLETTMSGFHAAGLRSHAVNDAFPLVFTLIQRLHDPVRATAVTRRAEEWSAGVPEFAPLFRYYDGLISAQTGDVRHAIPAFRAAHDLAQKYGEDVGRLCLRELAKVLATAGQARDALDLHRRILREPLTLPCEQSDAHVDFARALVAVKQMAADGYETPDATEDARAHLREAQRSLESCVDPWRQRNIVIELLLGAIADRDEIEARSLVVELEGMTGGRTVLLDVWQSEALGSLALLEGRPEKALAFFRDEVDGARRGALYEEEFRGQVAVGTALEAQNDWHHALAAYRAAESALDRLMAKVSFGEGVFGFAATHRRSASDLVRALVRLGKIAEAAEAARKARVRSLMLSAQSHRIASLGGPALLRWRAAVTRYETLRAELDALSAGDEVPGDELRGIQEKREARAAKVGEALDEAFQLLARETSERQGPLRAPHGHDLILLYDRDGAEYRGFALSGSEVVGRSLGAPTGDSEDARARYFLGPFAEEIARSDAVIFLLPDQLWSIDFHHLPFDGRPLVAHGPVSYALDVCGPDACFGAEESARGRGIFVVTDPSSDLAASRDEGIALAARLANDERRLTVVTGRDADHRRVRDQLSATWLFHYAGHGQYAGIDGYHSSLPLASRSELSLGDILTLPSPPARVILSACEGARVADDGGISLAHAFVAAGTHEVVAAPRAVSDRAAKDLALSLYRHGIHRSEISAARALREAQLEATPAGDAWAFRVVVP